MNKYTEQDVSILIPVYKPGSELKDCIASALATDAGEIIVSINDALNYPTSEFNDVLANQRITVIRQATQLGLWGNHFALIEKATKPWIKFLHGDDRIEEGFLPKMLAFSDCDVAVIGVLGIYQDSVTGEMRDTFRLDSPKVWSSDAYLRRVCVTGNELGCPSSTLWRRDLIDTDPQAWDNGMNCDIANNIGIASKGKVVIMPSGGIISGDHELRDTCTQGIGSYANRIAKTAEYLLRYPDIRVNKVGIVHGLTESIGLLRVIAGALRRGNKIRFEYVKLSVRTTWLCLQRQMGHQHVPWRIFLNAFMWKYQGGYKYGPRDGRNIGAYEPGE